MPCFVKAEIDGEAARRKAIAEEFVGAVFTGDAERVKMELAKGTASPDTADVDGVPMLLKAANSGMVGVVQVMLDAKANPNNTVKERNDGDTTSRLWCPGDTAVHLAAANGRQDVVELLLQCGASLTRPNTNGQSPLCYAARHGHISLVQWLNEEQGANLLEEDKSGRTVVHEAAGAGHVELLQWICECFDEVGKEVASSAEFKAIINRKDRWGKTPLHLAAYYQRHDCVKYLVEECNANPFTRDKLKGQRPATTAGRSPIRGCSPSKPDKPARRAKEDPPKNSLAKPKPRSRSSTSLSKPLSKKNGKARRGPQHGFSWGDPPAWVLDRMAVHDAIVKKDMEDGILVYPKFEMEDEPARNPVAESGVVEGWIRDVYNKDDADTTAGLKITLGPGVNLSNVPPSIVKRLKDLAIQTELEEAVEAKKALDACKKKLEEAKRDNKMKLAGELAAQALELEQTYLREQQEAENAVKQIRGM